MTCSLDLALDGDGTVHLAYAGSLRRPGGPYHIRYTRRPPGSDEFKRPRPIAAPSDDIASVAFPHLVIDGDNGVCLAWEQFRDARGRSRGLGCTMSTDGGETFASAITVPGTDDEALGFSGSQQGLLIRKLAVSDAGVIALVNSTFKQGETTSHVWLVRGQADHGRIDGAGR